ncbi:MAG: FeoA family protein [Lachnospiraceae bacterium]|nr:FeoA family protein [Lachnospiraceae bacterium]
MVIPLSHIVPGERGRIVWLASDAHMKQRLIDLGFAPEESLSCVLKTPRGGMSAYLVQGAVIALRQENANEIFVEV